MKRAIGHTVMRTALRVRLGAILLLLGSSVPVWAQTRMIILADPGHTIDDVLGIVLATKSWNVALDSVIVTGQDPEKRGRVACHALFEVGGDNVFVAMGRRVETDAVGVGPIYRSSEFFGALTTTDTPGSELLVQRIQLASENVAIVALGPLTVLADAVKANAEIVKKISQLTWSPGHDPEWEYFHRDPASAELVMTAVPNKLLVDPRIRSTVLWTARQRTDLFSQHIRAAYLLKPMAGMAGVSGDLAVPDLFAMACAIDPGCAKIVKGAPDSLYLPFPVDSREGLRVAVEADPKRFPELVDSVLSDRSAEIASILNAALNYYGKMAPAFAGPLERDTGELRQLVSKIQRSRKVSSGDTRNLLQKVHTLLHQLREVGDNAGKRMVVRLGTASALLAAMEMTFPKEYQEIGRFQGIQGGKAVVSVEIRNYGYETVRRSKLHLQDVISARTSSVSIADFLSGRRETRDFPVGIPPGVPLNLFRPFKVIFEYELLRGWASFERDVIVEIVPPFELSLSEVPSQSAVEVTFTRNSDIAKAEITGGASNGGWQVEPSSRVVEFSRVYEGQDQLTPLRSSASYSSIPRSQTVSFRIPRLSRKDSNILRLNAKNLYFEAGRELVLPYPGTNVRWLREVAGAIAEPTETGGFWCVATQPAKGQNHVCFDVDDSFLYASDSRVVVDVEYYDAGLAEDHFAIEYDSTYSAEEGGKLRMSEKTLKTGSRGWTRQRFELEGAYFGNRQPGGSDLRITDCGDGVEYIGWVTVSLPKKK